MRKDNAFWDIGLWMITDALLVIENVAEKYTPPTAINHPTRRNGRKINSTKYCILHLGFSNFGNCYHFLI